MHSIVKYKIKDINLAPYNPRIMTELEKGKLKASISEFGIVQNIIVNKQTKNVVGGNQRLQVLKELGYKELDVIELDLTLEKEKLLNLALNKISGDWDYSKLEDLFKEDFENVELSGFDPYEIESLLSVDNNTVEDFFSEEIREQTNDTAPKKIPEKITCPLCNGSFTV